MGKLMVTVKANTRLYSTENASRRMDILTKETIGWCGDNQNADQEQKRVLFHYPFYLGGSYFNKEAYINVSDIIKTEPIEKDWEDEPEEVSKEVVHEEEEFEKSNLTEEEVEIYHNNIKKAATPIGGSYFDEPNEGVNDPESSPSFIKRSVKIKPGITYDFDGRRIGHLSNDYYLESEDREFVILSHKGTGITCRILRTNLLGY